MAGKLLFRRKKQPEVSFQAVYEYYKGLMFHVAYNILKQREEAEDAVQEAFLAIAQNLSKISELTSLQTKAYVVTITENKAIRLYHRSRARPEVGLEKAAPGILVHYDEKDKEEVGLMEAILKLTPSYRQVILLKYQQGFSMKEIAVQLGVTQEAVYKLHQRAKKQLEELCRKEGIL